MTYPDDRRYAATHEWAMPSGDLVRVGISDFAQDQLGDIVFLDLPDVGRAVARGEAFGVVESVKAVADLNAPIAGEIAEVNSPLTDDLDSISKDPYGKGWMVLIRPADPAEFDTLMDAAAYQARCDEEGEV